jgi:methionyl-tRNA synthetase
VPDCLITNEFYLLDSFKFSTSQGHLIWAKDILEEVTSDEVRFYLAWSNPEFNQTNFSRTEMKRVLDQKFRAPLNDLVSALEKLPPDDDTMPSRYVEKLLARFSSAYDYHHQSLRIVALTVSNGFDLLLDLLRQGERPAVMRGVARAIACGLAPLAPGSAQRIWDASRATGAIRWPDASRSLSSE